MEEFIGINNSREVYFFFGPLVALLASPPRPARRPLHVIVGGRRGEGRRGAETVPVIRGTANPTGFRV